VRGNLKQLTKEVKDEARVILERDITQTDLRLLPYIDYCSKNPGAFKPDGINNEERKILSEWRELGLLSYNSSPGHSSMRVSIPFYWFMCHALLCAYVETNDCPAVYEEDVNR